jgi:hypothetical protein
MDRPGSSTTRLAATAASTAQVFRPGSPSAVATSAGGEVVEYIRKHSHSERGNGQPRRAEAGGRLDHLRKRCDKANPLAAVHQQK